MSMPVIASQRAATPAELAELRERLEALASQLGHREADLRELLAEPPSERSNAFIAGSEGGLAAEAQDEVIAQLHHEDSLLAEIKAALARLASGDYGACEDCGDVIGWARLEAVPWTTHCVSCQDRAEQLRRRLHA